MEALEEKWKKVHLLVNGKNIKAHADRLHKVYPILP